jgi:hypothetical protein
MSRSIFGWSLPPGAAGDPFAPWNQEEPPCELCGNCVEDCICPECQTCGAYGDPRCYVDHGLTQTEEQRRSLAEFAALQEQRAKQWEPPDEV